MVRNAPLTLPRPVGHASGARVEARRQFSQGIGILGLSACVVAAGLAMGLRPQAGPAPAAVAQTTPCTKAGPCQRSLVVVKAQPSRPATEALLLQVGQPTPDQGRS